MRLYAGQVPMRALRLLVTDDAGAPVDLNTYAGLALVVINPEGVVVPTSGGVLAVQPDGSALYAWPTTSLFPTPGDYRIGLHAAGGAGADVTERAVVEVIRERG